MPVDLHTHTNLSRHGCCPRLLFDTILKTPSTLSLRKRLEFLSPGARKTEAGWYVQFVASVRQELMLLLIAFI